ncbi:non-structural maintenance of chromosomes element 4 homolog A-like [Lingula anatina]|uniref:Non-structural maintenance of chromosomes element 4 n=1 Tax=Lingula anatina TaxID=7574 RepID=A0A1S3INE6_LINAN|nr:non-structural maintenance of chromosomes element 4 homolog A-like [Lingula anatina]|eukprot:XP_013399421.1 non-structural maintenance of chromosomes element 4 homolog A-like [Lingula anatina]
MESDSDEELSVPTEPEQTEDERRQLRHQYMVIQDELKARQHDLINPESEELTDKLKECNSLFQRVKLTREATKDSQALLTIAQLGRQKAQALQTDINTFNALEFSERLVNYISFGRIPATSTDNNARIPRISWEKFGEAVQPFFSRTPPLRCMLGTFERGPPERRVSNRNTDKGDRDAITDRTVPKQLKSVDEEEQREQTTEEVERIHRLLMNYWRNNKKKPVDYFEFVLNPGSYGHTIENMFHVAFLVRDNLAKILLDEYKLPVIEPVEKHAGDAPTESLQRHQCIVSITNSEFEELVRTFQVKTAAIKPVELKKGKIPSASGDSGPSQMNGFDAHPGPQSKKAKK